MRRYETIYILRPNLREDEINAIIDQTNAVIEKFDGQIVQVDRWGLKKLAYLINKEARGFYVYCEYAGMPEAVSELERLFRIDNRVLKYLTVKLQDVFVAEEIAERKAALQAAAAKPAPLVIDPSDDQDDDQDDDDQDDD